ncbi:MAG: DUF4386 domain-containing protein [Actinomycetia bacterium]|nr:DUF4386 domain-containing protein [Actinomycetes bacterium]
MSEKREGQLLRQAAIWAFVGLVLSFVGAILAVALGAPPDIGVTDDGTATAIDIADAGSQFRLAVVGWILAIIGDVVRAWAIYVFLRGVNQAVALLAAWWMLLHDAVFGFALSALLLASEVVGGTGAFSDVPADQVEPLMLVLLKLHYYGFNIGLLLFALHLLLNGYLVLRSEFIPKVFGILLIIASGSYVLDVGSLLVVTDPPTWINAVISVPAFVGEAAFVVWMLLKGSRTAPPTLDSPSETGLTRRF